jgi:hypothetical protein
MTHTFLVFVSYIFISPNVKLLCVNSKRVSQIYLKHCFYFDIIVQFSLKFILSLLCVGQC